MSKKVNGTDAKDVGLHFLRATGVERATPAIIAKTISQAKHILSAGYTKDEIISVIDHVVKKNPTIYSIGYISHAMNDALREINEDNVKSEAKEIAKQLEEQQLKERKAVTSDGESAKRNREKASRLGVQSRLGKKFNFDMFEK